MMTSTDVGLFELSHVTVAVYGVGPGHVSYMSNMSVRGKPPHGDKLIELIGFGLQALPDAGS